MTDTPDPTTSGADEIEIVIEGGEDDVEVDMDEGGEETGLEAAEQQPEPEVTAEDLADEVRRLTAEQGELRELYLRKLAEFDNFRKRTEREREEVVRTAGEGVVCDLIPVLDNFERALMHSAEADTAAFRTGVEMIAKQLWDVLQRQGLEQMDPTGEQFQPEYHDAVQRVDDSSFEPGQVVRVMAKGYLFCGKLVRPAMVAVAVGAPEEPEDRERIEIEIEVEEEGEGEGTA